MEVDFSRLPKKAKKRCRELKEVMSNANDKLYGITKVDYNTGMVVFESLLSERTLISLYISTGTISIFDKASRKIRFFRRLSVKEINKKFNNNQDAKQLLTNT